MFIKYSVKDKANKVPHNIWSCGDYMGNLNGFIYPTPDNTNTFIKLSNIHNTIGEYSILLKRISSSQYWLSLRYDYTPTSQDIGKTAVFSADVTTVNVASTSFKIGSSEIRIPANSEGNFIASTTISDTNPLQLFIGFSSSYVGEVYIDNIRLNIQ